MINTYSKFYFGQVITPENQTLDFRESSVVKTAILKVGSYTLTTLPLEVARALNSTGSLTYSVGVDRVTRKITISAGSAFDLLPKTGPTQGTGVFSMLGFVTTVDLVGLATYQGGAGCGSEYVPPFLLQDYLDPDDNQAAVDGVDVESCDGTVQSVSFGTKIAVEFNIKWVRAEAYTDGWITTTVNSVTELRAFLQFLRLKHQIEFVMDRATPANFYTIRLTSTPADQNGNGFKLNELYSQGLVGWYETGILKFRVMS